MDSEQNTTIGKQENGDRPRRLRLRYSRWIVKSIPFYFFIGVLAIIYIANGHYADKMMREISKMEREIKERGYEYKTVKRDVIFRSKESELAKAVEPLGLKELMVPPVRITDTLIEK